MQHNFLIKKRKEEVGKLILKVLLSIYKEIRIY